MEVTVGSTAVTTLTVALANWVLSASEVTVTVAVSGVDGAVYSPELGSMVPVPEVTLQATA